MRKEGTVVGDLEKDATSMTLGIFSGPGGNKLRCHEIARLLNSRLKERGYDGIKVVDGAAVYNPIFLIRKSDSDFLKHFFDSRLEEIEEQGKDKRNWMNVRHSWNELYTPDGTIVVDCHPSLPLVSSEYELYLEKFLIVEKMDEIKDNARYFPGGREFSVLGKTLIYFPPYHFVKLRI